MAASDEHVDGASPPDCMASDAVGAPAEQHDVRSSPLLLEAFHAFWGAALVNEAAVGVDAYHALFHRCYKVLIEDFQQVDIYATITQDWEYDLRTQQQKFPNTEEHDTLGFEAFGDGLFELAQVWSAELTDSELAAFLWRLLRDVSTRSAPNVPAVLRPLAECRYSATHHHERTRGHESSALGPPLPRLRPLQRALRGGPLAPAAKGHGSPRLVGHVAAMLRRQAARVLQAAWRTRRRASAPSSLCYQQAVTEASHGKATSPRRKIREAAAAATGHDVAAAFPVASPTSPTLWRTLSPGRVRCSAGDVQIGDLTELVWARLTRHREEKAHEARALEEKASRVVLAPAPAPAPIVQRPPPWRRPSLTRPPPPAYVRWQQSPVPAASVAAGPYTPPSTGGYQRGPPSSRASVVWREAPSRAPAHRASPPHPSLHPPPPPQQQQGPPHHPAPPYHPFSASPAPAVDARGGGFSLAGASPRTRRHRPAPTPPDNLGPWSPCKQPAMASHLARLGAPTAGKRGSAANRALAAPMVLRLIDASVLV